MLTDPVADMLTRIRNANLALHERVTMPSSKLKEEIARILASEGYIDGYEVKAAGLRKVLEVKLRYASNRHRVIEGIKRISRPGRRVYVGAGDLPRVNGGLGVAVVSTSQGLLPDREARRRSLGGEILCEVW
ncbi:MAG TPA: 30S ribosomal protein S8 [Acidimicrobiia bacterium]|uniref:Small ribosomal subunit protein uS8 n=1 Tax=uncultured actinobacterium Rifle_16ft_4_minimus_9892 TaxID=1665150 RepID=A0A0H4TDN2_9ACTN|nr:30S ribosomal protein S8, small subunit ribosomal protein S8 [uncultured actinobacterium Rifle_16ft_4_minimus_9892]HLA65902.1 30S ribosomal protein S8 [Acidimicrobiia bacterium]